MRKVTDLQRCADLVRTSFPPDKVSVEVVSPNSVRVVAPYLSPLVVRQVASSIDVGVYACGDSVMICFDKALCTD